MKIFAALLAAAIAIAAGFGITKLMIASNESKDNQEQLHDFS